MKPLNYAGGYLFGRPLAHRADFAAAFREGAKRWDVIHVEGGFVGALVPDDVKTPKLLSLHDAEVLRCKELLQCRMPTGERLRIHALSSLSHALTSWSIRVSIGVSWSPTAIRKC